METKRIIVLIVLLLVNLWFDSAFAATYYVNPSSTDDSGSGTVTSPKKYISSGIALMSSGDTLILENGVYRGDNLNGGTASNMIAPNNYHGRKFPPNGTAGAYTTIKARNIGQAIIDGEYTSSPFHSDNASSAPQYIHVDGIHFRNAAGANDPVGGGVFGLKASHSKVTNCGFEDGGPVTDSGQWPIAYIAGGSDHVLFEDCWAWGRGRYGIYFQSTGGGVTNSILRRCVIRQDSSGQGPTAGIMFYNSRGNVVQNCIVIDSRVNHSTSDTYGAFSLTANDGLGVGNNVISGSIALNNINYAGIVSQASIGTDAVTIENSILWSNGTSYFSDNGFPHGLSITTSDLGTYTANHVTSGANQGSGFRSNSAYSGILNVLNSISVNNGSYGLQAIDSANYVNTYNNIAGASVDSTVTNGLTSNPFATALKYLPRIENGLSLKGMASDSGDIGATILYQIGGSGSFYGDTGWNIPSNNQLWPYSNEGLWAAKMKAYTVSGPGGNRGFAALSGSSTTPLTDYIWGYLGNPKPANIYGGVSAPAAPKNVIKTN